MRSFFSMTCILLFLSSTVAARPRLMLPEGVFYYKPAASVFGPEAAWVNPAALSRYHTAGYQLMADIRDGSTLESWGSVAAHERLAIGYRSVKNGLGDDYNEVILAVAAGMGKTFMGGSYRYFKDAPDLFHKKHFWNVGLAGQSGGQLAWGIVWSNLNRSRVDHERSEIEQRYSLSYRPVNQLVTLSVDMMLSTGTRFKKADYVYHAEVTPYRGLFAEGYVTSDGDFQLGVRANLLEYFVGSQSFFAKNGDHRHTTTYIGASGLSQKSLIQPKHNRRLNLTLSGSIPENPPRPVFGRQRVPFVEYITTIYRAAEDPSVREMVVYIRGLALGFGQAQELRGAIEAFRSQGKTVICHLSYPNNIGYYVASAADSILIPPVSQLNLVGLRAELTFYTGAMEKLGIKADMVRIGDYKSAPEQFTHRESSEPHQEQLNRLLDDLYEQFISTIASGRKLPEDSVRAIVDNGPYTSQDALRYGIVDGLSYQDNLCRGGFLTPFTNVSFESYRKDTLLNDGWPERPVLAVVVAEGDIAPSQDDLSPFDNSTKLTPSGMKQALQQVQRTPHMRGIVLRVNSPGGFALASDEIHHYLDHYSEHLPLTVSMGNVAASGGYYIAMPASHLFANPATVTGSIGIYGGKVDLSGLYDKIDLGHELYTRGHFAGMLTATRPFTDEEREKYFSQLAAFYHHYVSLVSAQRSLTTDSVDALAQGRVWTGREADANGLVDELGGLKPSLDYTAQQVGIRDYRVAVYPERRPWLLLPAQSLFGKLSGLLFGSDPSEAIHEVDASIPTDGEIITRLPYDLTIE